MWTSFNIFSLLNLQVNCGKRWHKTCHCRSQIVILYDLSYNYHNYVLTLSHNNPKINLIVR